jgi:very-short-patch-repair endonuclease
MSQTGEENASAIKWAIEQARKELVDPSRRNRLLHAPLSGKRPWCLAVAGQSADDVFGSLYRQENFRGYAFASKPTEGGELEAKTTELTLSPAASNPSEGIDARMPRKASSSRLQLQTELDAEKLEKRLTKIFREERTLQEEQGISTLYLAVGFLKWFDSEQSDEGSYAPLILLPVSLIRVRTKEGFLLVGRDEEVVVNISLLEKLKSEFSVSLPTIPENDEWNPSSYFDDVEQQIRRYRKWSVERETIGLGFFTFSKFLMWRDLDASTWPNGALLSHQLLNVLIGDGGQFEADAPLVSDDEPIDRTIDISKVIHVVDADSSQAVVIEEARTGRNLVVQGPPGTGKSQTITNIISAAVHGGKTVLFVAEKTAALSVVQDRLARAGLGALCLPLHSKNANKREVLKALDDALRFTGSQRADTEAADNLASYRDQLNEWSDALHRPIGQSGCTPYQVIGTQVRLRADNTKLLPIELEEVAGWSKEEIDSALASLDRASDALVKLGGRPFEHPWFGTGITIQSPFDNVRLKSALDEAIEQLDLLQSRVTAIYEKVVGKGQPTLEDAYALARAFRHLAAAPQGRETLTTLQSTPNLDKVSSTINQGEELAHQVSQVTSQFHQEAWSFDTAALFISLRADGPSFLRRWSGRYRKAQADLRALLKTEPPKDLESRISLVEILRDGQAARQAFTTVRHSLEPALGSLWNGLDTNWTQARDLIAWLTEARSNIAMQQMVRLATKSADVSTFTGYADDLDEVTKDAASAFVKVFEVVQPSSSDKSVHEFNSLPLFEFRKRLVAWLDNIESANDWVATRTSLENLGKIGFGSLGAGLVSGEYQPTQVNAEARLLITEALWKRAVREQPQIANIDGSVRSQHVDDFQLLDKRRIRSARNEVLARYCEQRPNGYIGEMSIVRGEIEKKRGHRAVRKLIIDAGSAVQRIKPVFLMSPLSVAQFLPPGRLTFDLLVIDEASQVAPEDALGVVARAKQIVVVGDHKQLPPTNFFKMVNAGSEDADEDSDVEIPVVHTRPGDFESILTLARTRGMSERMLGWHYRSKHPSLIALSNDECYGGRLLLPPSPFVQSEDLGVRLVKTPRGFYDRGGTSRDLVQAEEVAKAVSDHIRCFPTKSLGVACLSVQQREAVYEMLDKIGIRGEVESFAPKDERLFVKNLEAVQGDERDVIFISVGYGVAQNQSRPFLNFGPVSRDGGERRLNVLASRAREKCVVFSSITAADIPAESPVRGTRMLRSLLHLAETGALGAGSFRGGDYDSPFEEAVARVIREAGFHVHSQVGVSSFRIDLGVINPSRPGEYVVGVECDGATYHSARSARDRDRLRQEVLQGLGWQLYRVWSTDWFRNPDRESEKLLKAIRAADAGRQKSQNEPEAEEPSDDDFSIEEVLSAGEDLIDEQPTTPEVHYVECSVAVPLRRGILDLPVSELSRLSLNVVEAEGPIHAEEVARRLREAFGLQKTGSRIFNHVRDSLDYLKRAELVARDDDFWTIQGREATVARSRRNAPMPLRRASMIAPAEYRIAIAAIINEAISISAEQLAVETARRFGFERTGQELKQEIDRQMKALIDVGRIVRDGSILRAAAATS